MYGAIDEKLYIDLGEYGFIHRTIKDTILEIFDKKIDALYEFMRENLHLMPYILCLTMESTDILNYKRLFDDQEVTLSIINMIDKCLRFTMNEPYESDIKDSTYKFDINHDPKYKDLLVNIYLTFTENINFIYKQLKAIDEKFNFNEIIARKLLQDKISYKTLKIIQSSYLSLFDGSIAPAQVLPFCEYYETKMAYDRNNFIKEYINEIKNLLGNTTEQYLNDNSLDAIRNKFVLYSLIKDIKSTNNSIMENNNTNIYLNFYFWNYILIDDKLYILQKYYNNHYYLRLIDDHNPFTIKELIYSYTINDNIEFFYNMLNKVFEYIPNATKINDVLIAFNLTYFIDDNYYISEHENYNHFIFQLYFGSIFNTIIAICDNYKEISIKEISLICKKNGVIFDNDNDFEIMLYLNNYRDGILISRSRYILSTKKDKKPVFLIIKGETASTSRIKDGYFLSRYEVDDTIDNNLINIIHEKFCAQKDSILQSYNSITNIIKESIIDSYPTISYNGNIDDFKIEYEYYYKTLEPNHKFLYNWS